MTESAPTRARWSKGQLRVIAWLSAGLAFLLSGTAIAMAPKPPTHDAQRRPRPAPRKTVVQHRVIRRVVYDPPVPTGGGATVFTATADTSVAGATTTAPTSSGGSSGPTGVSGSSGSSGAGGGTSSGGGASTTTTGGS